MSASVNRPIFRHRLFVLIVALLLGIIGRNYYLKSINARLAVAVQTGRLAEVKSLLAMYADARYIVPSEQPEQPKNHKVTIDKTDDSGSMLYYAFEYLAFTESDLYRRLFPAVNRREASWTAVVVMPTTSDIGLLRTHRDEATALVCLLIEHGADPTRIPRRVTYTHASYLAWACSLGNLTVVRYLLAHQPSLARLDRGGDALSSALDFDPTRTTGRWQQHVPFYFAAEPPSGTSKEEMRFCRQVSMEMVGLLREHGAHLNLDQAALMGDLETLQQLLPQAQPEDVVRALGAAVDSGNLKIASLLMPHVAATHLPELLSTELSTAAEHRDAPMARLLLEHGADINAEVLGITCRQGDRTMVDLLLAHGANVKGTAKGGTSPINLATQGRHADIVRLLLSKGAAPESLLTAIICLPELVPDLLRRGADVNRPGTEWLPPGTVSIRSTGAAQITPLGAAVWYSPQCVQELLNAGAKLGLDRQSILIHAAAQGRVEIFDRLLALGADVNGTDSDGETPLTQAVQHAPRGVRTLLEHGANPNAMTKQRRTPLQFAAITGDADVTRLLLQHGADVNLQPRRDHTALYYARKHQHSAVIALLEEAGGHVE